MKDEKLTVSSIVKKYIAVRGKTEKDVAKAINMPYTTFNGILSRDSVQAYVLFDLKQVLDMDLEWMASILSNAHKTSAFEPLFIPRMKDEMREHELPIVEKEIKMAIVENPSSIASARNQVLAKKNLYYVLDVLLPPEYGIQAIYEEYGDKRQVKYYCVSPNERMGSRRVGFLYDSIKGKEMLDILIAERMEI